jgi:hypothetical protein
MDMRRFLAFVVWRTFQAVLRGIIALLRPDPWERIEQGLAVPWYGSGAPPDFREYLSGISSVDVESVDDICSWLRTCTFATDEALFGRADVWQHPLEFEVRRAGDCDCHALWAWRKLHELGISAEFLSGRRRLADGNEEGHCWVQLVSSAGSLILESTEKEGSMLRPLSSAREEYIPHLAVSTSLARVSYWGLLYKWAGVRAPGAIARSQVSAYNLDTR